MIRATDDWPPKYTLEFKVRQKLFYRTIKKKEYIYGSKMFYKDYPADFINDWCLTYDPRNAATSKPTIMPFILFKRQKEFIQFLQECLRDQQSGLVEKTRDVGITWLCCGFSVWLWLFTPGASVGWGSRKEALVDRIGDPDSIFEKMRMIIRYLPKYFLPKKFNVDKDTSYMKMVNPENSATITGEAGDNIGRGGRKLIYFKDESAHYERPEKIEAALSHNTNVQIDLSSVNGSSNIFARRRRAGIDWKPGENIERGKTRVFVFDWRDHPDKTQEWYNKRKITAKNEGLSHIFAQEVDRDYSSSVAGIVIKPKWIRAAIDADLSQQLMSFRLLEGKKIAALDVADEGGDKNAYVIRKGLVCFGAEYWGEGDTGKTTKRAIRLMKNAGCRELQYDSIGVGSGIKASVNLLKERGDIEFFSKTKFVKWNAGSKVINGEQRIIKRDKETPKNVDFYSNLKAQAWWSLRTRFEKTYNYMVMGQKYPEDELISIRSSIPVLEELVRELSQPTYSTNSQGKIVIDKAPAGSTSPNLADAFVMCFFPLKGKKVII